MSLAASPKQLLPSRNSPRPIKPPSEAGSTPRRYLTTPPARTRLLFVHFARSRWVRGAHVRHPLDSRPRASPEQPGGSLPASISSPSSSARDGRASWWRPGFILPAEIRPGNDTSLSLSLPWAPSSPCSADPRLGEPIRAVPVAGRAPRPVTTGAGSSRGMNSLLFARAILGPIRLCPRVPAGVVVL
jgi:hypothetical protein